MFGLTRREQRWKAEQKQLEAIVPLIVGIVQAAAAVRIAEAQQKQAQPPQLPAGDSGEGGQ